MVNVKLSVLWTYCVSCKYKTYVSLYKGRGDRKGNGEGERERGKGGLEGRVGREGWKGGLEGEGWKGGGFEGERRSRGGGKDGFMASTSITWVCCPLV